MYSYIILPATRDFFFYYKIVVHSFLNTIISNLEPVACFRSLQAESFPFIVRKFEKNRKRSLIICIISCFEYKIPPNNM